MTSRPTTPAFPRVLPLATVLGFLALPLAAQGVDAALDANGDGLLSYAELIVGYPDLTSEGFTVMDASGDGVLDSAEVADAIAAGLIAPSDG